MHFRFRDVLSNKLFGNRSRSAESGGRNRDDEAKEASGEEEVEVILIYVDKK